MAVERLQAQQGQTVILRSVFMIGATPADPFQVRQVEILDGSFAVIDTIPAASIIHDGPGRYHIDWPIAAALAVDVYYDRWYATASSGGTEEIFTYSFNVESATSGFPGTGGNAYLTTTEARSYLPVDTTLTDAEIQENILLASETAEMCTGQVFIPMTEARVFDGTGRAVLPIYRPILSVSRIEVLGCGSIIDYDLNVSDIRIGRSHKMLALGNVLSHSQGGMFRGSGRWSNLCSAGPSGCGLFPPGFQNIRVTGTWGRWTQTPRQIKAAIGALLRYALVCDDPQPSMTQPLATESVAADRSWQMRKIWAKAAVDATTGYADVDAIFARYMAPPVVGWV
jgi:hypothetical protein